MLAAWLAHKHGVAAVLDFAEELAVDLAEAVPSPSSATRWRSPTAGLTISPRWTCPAAPPPQDCPTPTGDVLRWRRVRPGHAVTLVGRIPAS
jgi:hypothetical protein